MTDNEQNADVSKTLTEQWNKGELPNGWYYVRLIRGEHRIDLYINSKNEWIDCPDDIIDTVVCKVPSYEEWQDVKDDLATCDKDLNNVCEQKEELYEENIKLKELLKECKQWFDWYHIDTKTGKEYIESWHKKGYSIHQRIDQVLGEE